jgi:hypothetical protein
MNGPTRSLQEPVRRALARWRYKPRHKQVLAEWGRSYVTPDKALCPTCGKTFDTARTGTFELIRKGFAPAPATRVFCSNACRQKAYRKRRAPECNTTQPNAKLSDAADQ